MEKKSWAIPAGMITAMLLLVSVPLLGACGKEVVKEVVKEVPVQQQVIKEVPVERVVVKEVPKEVVKEVPVERVIEKEVIREVPVERVVVKEVPAKPAASDIKQLRILDGPVGSQTFISCAIWADAIRKDLGITTGAFPGSPALNYPLINSGEGDFSPGDAGTALDALQGKGSFKQPLTNLAGMLSKGSSGGLFHVRADSNIHLLSDLMGKKIGIGTQGSTTKRAGMAILEAAGMTEDKIRESGGALINMDYSEMQTSLADRTIDAAIMMVSPDVGHASAMAVDEISGIRLVPIPPDVMANMIKANPVFVEAKTKPGIYKGMKDSVTFGVSPSIFIARGDLPEELVYNVMKVLYSPAVVKDTKERSPLWQNFGDTEDGILGAHLIPMHPGAAKFWQERGVDLKARGITVFGAP